MLPTFTEARHSGEFILSELTGHGSRDNVVIAATTQTIIPGAVLGAIDAVGGTPTSSSAADASNTGNGTLTLDGTAPVGAGAKDGVYRVLAIAATEFSVTDPEGKEIGRVATAATFNGPVKFALAAGGVAFAVGDAFSVTVGLDPITGRQFVELNPSGADGSQIAAGIAIYAATTDNTTPAPTSAIMRSAEVNSQVVTWPAGITTAQKAEAIVQLRKAGISLR